MLTRENVRVLETDRIIQFEKEQKELANESRKRKVNKNSHLCVRI
jgi:hypothetical protein